MSDKLQPCPFCGSRNVNDTSEPKPGEDGDFYWVCPDCVCVGPVSDTLEGATDLWNKRGSHVR